MEPFLATTPAKMSDSKSFFNLIQDKEIRKEFVSLREISTIEQATLYLDGQIRSHFNLDNKNFFKLIRIVFSEDTESYNDTNSILVGFISLHDAGMMDQLLTGGFNQNLSFAIISQYRNKGIMTTALNMTLDAMYADTYNLVPALVKPENIESAKVLKKCGFDEVSKSPMGSLFVRRLTMDEFQYKKIFGL